MSRASPPACCISFPYLGPALIVIGSGLAAFSQFDSALHALAIAGAALLVVGAIGLVLMTWLQGRAARVNAAELFIALLFFGWLWGIWGLLLSAPLVASSRQSATASRCSSRSANCLGVRGC